MPGIREALLVGIGATSVAFTAIWWRDLRRRRAEEPDAVGAPSPVQLAIGAVTNFFDTLGIGSFATTTAAFKALRLVPDEQIPGTLLIGHSLPAILQGFIFIAAVSVDPVLMLVLIAALVAGGGIGARWASRLPRRPIQLGMGVGLTLAALFMAMSQLGLFPAGGTAIALPTGRLLVAAAAFALFGGLVMVGIGHFAPSLIVLSLLGMDPRATFPVMMGAAALLTTVGGRSFMRERRYAPRAALGLTLGGIPAVLVAAFLVKSLPLATLRWIVVVVVLYAAAIMLRAAMGAREPIAAAPAT